MTQLCACPDDQFPKRSLHHSVLKCCVTLRTIGSVLPSHLLKNKPFSMSAIAEVQAQEIALMSCKNWPLIAASVILFACFSVDYGINIFMAKKRKSKNEKSGSRSSIGWISSYTSIRLQYGFSVPCTHVQSTSSGNLSSRRPSGQHWRTRVGLSEVCRRQKFGAWFFIARR